MEDVEIADFNRVADLAGCVAAYVNAFAAAPWHEQWSDATVRDRLLQIADTPGNQFLVARDGSRVLGLLAGYVESFHPSGRFQLAELAVDPTRQRRGVASGLVAELMDRLAVAGIGEIFLITSTRGAALDFWQTQSFAVSKGRTVMARRLK